MGWLSFLWRRPHALECRSRPNTVRRIRGRPTSRRKSKSLAFEALEQRTLLNGNSLRLFEHAERSFLRLIKGHHADRIREPVTSPLVASGPTARIAAAGGNESVTQPLASLPTSASTADKPQSKVWRYADQWWGVFPNTSGTYVWRLDGTSWSQVLKLSASTTARADTLAVGDVTHVLLFRGKTSELASVQYVSGTYQFWSQRPALSTVPLPSGVETATIAMDSTGRLWVAADGYSTVEVRYSDAPYASWSPSIALASGISSDDIAVVGALPNGTLGVMWSNQNIDRFGFRVHVDGSDPTIWSADEVPASQSALNVGGGMADDHLNLAIASDGTLYAAVKTGYDTAGLPEVALLVRRANGLWDDLYQVDVNLNGTRPIVVLNEATGCVTVIYTESDGGGDIVYRESPVSTISFGPRTTLIPGSLNDASSTKQNVTDELLVVASTGGTLSGALVTYSGVSDQAPVVSAGPDQTLLGPSTANLDGSADEGQPNPVGPMTITWSKLSGPGTVTFGNPSSVDTHATFSTPGTYVLRLTAVDAGLSSSDDVTAIVNDFSLTSTSFQNGVFPTPSYSGSRDTKIRSGSPNTNFGTSLVLGVDGSPDEATLLRWDLASIPAGSLAHSATITINVTDRTVDVYEIYEVKRDWVESQATWNVFSTGNNWQIGGAEGASDRGSMVLGSASSISSGLLTIGLNAAGVALIQAWIDNPSSNHGIIFLDYAAASDALGFSSRENGTPGLRPRLNIIYRPGNDPPLNRPPQASDDTGTTNEDNPLIVSVLTNDSDPDGDILTVVSVSDPPSGTALINPDGTIRYTPNTNFNGSDSFTYELSDGHGGIDTATVAITVNPVNDPPSFSKGPNQTVVQDAGPQTVPGWATNIRAGPADESTQVLSFVPSNNNAALFADPPVVTPDGTLTYTAAAGATGVATVTLTLRDSGGTANGGSDTSAPQTFTITVNPTATHTTASFQDGVGGYAGTRDAVIRFHSPTTNYGSSSLGADGSPDESSLLRWDISSISPGSTVSSVTITINLTDGTPDFYELYELKRPWVESEVTWNQSAVGTPWEIPGAQGASDRGDVVLGTVGSSVLGQITITLGAAGVALVQQWVNDPGANYGIIIQDYIAASNGLNFSSRENGTVVNRPKLTVVYQ